MTELSPRSFKPGPLLRSPHLQSFLAGASLRGRWIRCRSRALRRSAACLLDCGNGARLQAFVSPADGAAPAPALAVLLHGWEGSAESTYLLSLARHLGLAGYAVFRLNFRDHGETQELNRELFHSCRLGEVLEAVRAMAAQLPASRLFLVGFSLGGNFALRVALQAPERGIRLDHVVAVSPVIDPGHVLEAIERSPAAYQRRFMKKWHRSLRRKHELFPDLFDIEACLRCSDLRELTRFLIEGSGEFDSLEQYLDGYSIAGDRLAGLQVPATIVTAADDPIIPVRDFAGVTRPPCLTLEIQQRGGHCGFIENLALRSWIDHRIESLLSRAAGSSELY
jgi:predicted alpha/beta-fold hydrolase